MATPYPGQPNTRRRIVAADVAHLTHQECLLAAVLLAVAVAVLA